MNEKRNQSIDEILNLWQGELTAMSDRIFDLAEPSFQEFLSAETLEDFLEKHGFQVERGLKDLPTAFRAEWKQGDGGPSIGLLCEYDALSGMGHGCAHHLQGPAVAGAAIAVKELVKDQPCRLVIYGTPGEETTGGKVDMLAHGYFQDIDIALMMHGGPATQTDIKSMALSNATVTFHGKSAHAAIRPDLGRSAFDALLLTFNGIEFLREHVLEDTRIHYTITQSPGASNVVHDKAVGSFDLRSYNSMYLDTLIQRFENIVRGAALMTETTYEIAYAPRFESKVPVHRLNQLLMDQARWFHAPTIRPVREKTGSTDFGNVIFQIPGACIRIAFVPEGTPSHSQKFLDNGKSCEGHQAVLYGAKILAATVCDLISEPELLGQIKQEFAETKAALSKF